MNLHPLESDIAAMPIEHLESMNVTVGTQPTRARELSRLQNLHDVELEGRQKIWKWLLVMALGILILETALAGRQLKTTPISAGVAS